MKILKDEKIFYALAGALSVIAVRQILALKAIKTFDVEGIGKGMKLQSDAQKRIIYINIYNLKG